MRLVDLEVQRFGCIKRARLSFARGLNLVYGPNDLGKSTLVQAMRAALLLPHNSRAFEDFRPWQEPDATPEVKLTFEVRENGSPRFYQVHKQFPHGAQLAWSNDGRSFSNDTRKAREVDEKLRTLLQWGVPAAGASRGMPESFLAKVLMASQPEVTGILGAALGQDKDPSGKQRIMGAMEAMLEEPLFKKVLGRAVERVKEAFSETGRRRSGKGSPWIGLRDKINAAEEVVSQLQAVQENSVTVLAKARALQEEVLLSEASVEQAKQQLERLTARWKEQQTLAEQEAQFVAADAGLLAERQRQAALDRAQAELARALEQRSAHQQALAECKATTASARGAKEAAEQGVRKLESADAAREAELRQSRLRERQTQLSAEIAEQTRQGERAQLAGKKHKELAELQKRLQVLQDEVARKDAEFRAADLLPATARTELELLKNVARYRRYQDSCARLKAAEAAEREAERQRQAASAARAQAKALELELQQQRLPEPAELQRLRELQRQLEVQEAALDLGLTAQVTPHAPPLAVDVTADHNTRHEELFAVTRFTARESLSLKLPGATVVLTAAAAAQVQELRERWQERSAPVFEAAQVQTLAELEARGRQAAAHAQEAERLRALVNNAEAAVSRLETDAARVGALQRETEDAERLLDGAERAELEERAAAFSSESELERAVSGAERQLQQADERRAAAQRAIERSQAQLGALKEQCTAARGAFEDAAAPLSGDWQAVLQQVVQSLQGMKTEKERIEGELGVVASAQNEALAKAQAALSVAEQTLAAAQRAEDKAAQAVQETEQHVAAQRVRLEVAEQGALGLDLMATQTRVAQLQQQLAAAQQVFLSGGSKLTQSDLADAQAALEQARGALNDKRNEAAQAQGSLMEVGGAVVEEELAEAREALENRKREQKELELEYGAWQLLQRTLREAEKSESAHLGEKLSAPLQARFAALTGGRYTQLDLGTDLKTEGFTLAGELRPVSALSAGTQEQLSTLFRLCLAETLETAVVLDDHLSQTDSMKMIWFRSALEEVSKKAQVIIISCWPEHYKLPKGEIDTAHRIDAGAVVERY